MFTRSHRRTNPNIQLVALTCETKRSRRAAAVKKPACHKRLIREKKSLKRSFQPLPLEMDPSSQQSQSTDQLVDQTALLATSTPRTSAHGLEHNSFQAEYSVIEHGGNRTPFEQFVINRFDYFENELQNKQASINLLERDVATHVNNLKQQLATIRNLEIDIAALRAAPPVAKADNPEHSIVEIPTAKRAETSATTPKKVDKAAPPTTFPSKPEAVKANLSKVQLFVRNIPYACTFNDVLHHFTQHGNVVDLRMPLSPNTSKSRGIAFVTYSQEQFATEALVNLDGQDFKGRAIRVFPARLNNREIDNEGTTTDFENGTFIAPRNIAKRTGNNDKAKAAAAASTTGQALYLIENASFAGPSGLNKTNDYQAKTFVNSNYRQPTQPKQKQNGNFRSNRQNTTVYGNRRYTENFRQNRSSDYDQRISTPDITENLRFLLENPQEFKDFLFSRHHYNVRKK